jgi:uncharacterized membrane protein (DUF2068 family)
MVRPAGIKVIAVICFLVAVFVVFNGIQLFTRSGFMAAVFSERYQATNSSATSGLPELAAGVFLDLIIVSALYALAGWGLWKLKSWGPKLVFFLIAIAVTFELLRWLLTLHFKLSTVVTLALYGVTIWYLLKPDVKAAFPPLDRKVI